MPTELSIDPAARLAECPVHARIVRDPVELACIADPAINLAIWQRDLPQGLELLWRHLLSRSTAIDGDWAGPHETTLRDELNKQVRDPLFRPAVAWWAHDIAVLAQRYTEFTGVVHPRVRLERVQDGGCVLFHEDHMELRLLCTYAGPGMQWLAKQDVDRSQLGLQGRRVPEANEAIARGDLSRVRSIPTGHVAVFKGALHPRNEAGALIHRSAPVAGPSEYRIRLCIDDTSDCAC